MPHALLTRPHWIFDLDGTLTVPAHDFAAFKKAHSIPMHQDLLTAASLRSVAARAELMQAIADWEVDIARASLAQADAAELLDALVHRGANIGIVTRNTKTHALLSLQAAGLGHYFRTEWVYGRTCATPKPAPDALNRLLHAWGARPEDAVMVGDGEHDIRAGRNAGCATVLIERHGPVPDSWLPDCDALVPDLRVLLAA